MEKAHVWAMCSLRSWSLALVQYCRGMHVPLFLANIALRKASVRLNQSLAICNQSIKLYLHSLLLKIRNSTIKSRLCDEYGPLGR